jgi:hypothetical protein
MTTLTMVFQPDSTGMCGEACVAMAAGVTLDEAVRAVGSSVLRQPGTDDRDLIRGLRKLGVKLGPYTNYEDRKSRIVQMPDFAIMSVVDDKTKWGHWVVVKDGVVYDPGIGWPMPTWVYESIVIERAFSRRFMTKGHKHKSVKAYWGEVIPIVGKE